MRTKSKSSITTDLLLNPHPGEILLEEFLRPMDLSQTKLAQAIGVSPRRINEIVLGKRAITADTDLRLRLHILNTRTSSSPIGAFRSGENASASTRRVSLGAMMPSSHSRAVA